MSGLITEIINDAINSSISTTDLLRKCLVAAKRLNINELAEWFSSELHGYNKNIPEYRVARGQLICMNPVRGPIPLEAPPEMVEIVTKVPLGQSLPELQRLSESDQGIIMFFSAKREEMLLRSMSDRMRPGVAIGQAKLRAIIDQVRTKVIEWAIDLESKGVVGEGMTFTPKEINIVKEQHIHIGSITGSQVQIDSPGGSQNQQVDSTALIALIKALENAFEQKQIASHEIEELSAELQTLKAQARSPKPKWEIVQATAKSIKSIMEKTATSVAASHITHLLAPLLGI